MTTIKTLEELGRALDNGERVDRSTNENGLFWAPLSAHFDMPLNWYIEQIEAGNLRIAPKMTFIEGKGGRFEFPEPITESPTLEVECWLVCVTAGDIAVPIKPTDFDFDSLLSKGLVHLTEEAAKQHANAILKAMGVNDDNHNN